MQPQTWLIDFEAGMIAALRVEYPGLLVMGCYFHYAQCLVRKLQEFALIVTYETDVEFKVICQQLAALAFVPIPSIRESFDLVVESIPQRYAAMLAPFLAYFQVPKNLSTISFCLSRYLNFGAKK